MRRPKHRHRPLKSPSNDFFSHTINHHHINITITISRDNHDERKEGNDSVHGGFNGTATTERGTGRLLHLFG